MPVCRVDAYRTLGFAAITSSFLPLGAALSHNWRAWRVTNNTNGDLIISLNGTTNNLFVPANSFVLYDISSNADSDASEVFVMALGTQFYVKYATVPTTGDVYLEGIYQQGQ